MGPDESLPLYEQCLKVEFQIVHTRRANFIIISNENNVAFGRAVAMLGRRCSQTGHKTQTHGKLVVASVAP